MVNLGVKTSPDVSEHSDWSDATTSYIEARATCPHCGKKLRIACDKDQDSLHIQKDQD